MGMALSALRRISIVIAIAVVFVLGLTMTVYLSLRSPEVKVPNVMGKERYDAERVLGEAGLNFRVRAVRPNSQLSANTVLFQLPRAGELVKAGQTVAMDISRAAKEGEASETLAPEPTPDESAANENANEPAANENRLRRNRNSNKNGNDNANTNAGNRNANRNANSGNTNRANLNSNRPAANGNTNANRGVNQNGIGRPAAARPSPTARPRPENP
jgi:beta-lactam-binding protein with PASTA domain